jgi:hypothetical protein
MVPAARYGGARTLRRARTQAGETARQRPRLNLAPRLADGRHVETIAKWLRVVLPLAALFLIPAIAASPASAAVCADHPDQASAQRAADTRDADGDGIFCQSLPCPCATGGSGDRDAPPVPAPACARPTGVQNVTFSATKYPHIRTHFLAALREGWPRTLVLNRSGTDARRDRLLEGFPTRSELDRDEYPPAVGRGRGRGLVGGAAPRGWEGSVAYVPSSENRSHGTTLGIKLRRFCDGVRFRYVFY